MLEDMLEMLIAFIIFCAISFMIVAAFVYLICWVLTIKFVLRYAIAAWLICLLLRWVLNTR